jgi:carboxymethylenebutenolidase
MIAASSKVAINGTAWPGTLEQPLWRTGKVHAARILRTCAACRTTNLPWGVSVTVILENPFPRGAAPIRAYGPLNNTSAPIVLLFMDAFGPRPTLDRIAERLVTEGYRVLLPDLFYDHLPYVPLDPQSVFSGGEDRQRLMKMFGGLDQHKIDEDVQSLLVFCAERLGSTAPIGVTGYCMGGRYALTAATATERVVFAASFHGSNLAPDSGIGAHTRFARLRARIYIGVAEIDPTFGAAEEGRLAAALRDASADHVIETYAGARHGFVMQDLPAGNPAAADRHWLRLSTELREAFARSKRVAP